jgi:DNA-binding LacI/PurR family transcriptional regulator
MEWEPILVDDVDNHPELPIVRADFEFAKGQQATEQVLRNHPDLTCLFAANDLSALGALSYLASQNINVPEQMALVGFDDILMASLVHPALTTVRQPVYDMGVTGARLLLDRIEHPANEVKRQVFDPVLVLRQSC